MKAVVKNFFFFWSSSASPPRFFGCGTSRFREPGLGEVRVRMIASPVSPPDLLVVQSRYGVLPTLPATPGFEGVGWWIRWGGSGLPSAGWSRGNGSRSSTTRGQLGRVP